MKQGGGALPAHVHRAAASCSRATIDRVIARLAVASVGIVSVLACTPVAPTEAERPSSHVELLPAPQAAATEVQVLEAGGGDGLTLRRTLCFGRCPAYQVTLRPDGTVEWWGFGHVARIGPARDMVAVDEVTRLTAELERLAARKRAAAEKAERERSRSGRVSLDFSSCTDTSSTTITLTRGGQQSIVGTEHCDEAEAAPVSRVAAMIDAAAQTSQWITDDACKPTLSSGLPDICVGADADAKKDCALFIPPLMAALGQNADAHVRLWVAADAPSARERLGRAREALVARGVADARIHRYLFPAIAEDPGGWDNGGVRIEVGSAACMRIETASVTPP